MKTVGNFSHLSATLLTNTLMTVFVYMLLDVVSLVVQKGQKWVVQDIGVSSKSIPCVNESVHVNHVIELVSLRARIKRFNQNAAMALKSAFCNN